MSELIVSKKKAIDFLCAVTHKNQLINVLTNSKLLGTTNTKLVPVIPSEKNVIYGYKNDDNSNISCLTKVEINTESSTKVDNEDIFCSSNNKAKVITWQENKEHSNKYFKTFESDIEETFTPTKILSEPPPELTQISPNTLKWVANTYRALIKKEDNSSLERVPAWCNIAMLNTMDSGKIENEVCVLTSPRDTNKSPLPFAYIRDGLRGLISYDVPHKNGYLWRAGIAITDLLGFTHELDPYSAVEGAEKALDEKSPIIRVLKNSLRKLNGSVYQLSSNEPKKFDKELPISVERTLLFLSNYPDESDSQAEYQYAFLSEIETGLMRQRLITGSAPENKAELPWLYSEAVKSLLRKVPVAWFHHFKVNDNTSKGLRKESNFWLTLFSIFKNNLSTVLPSSNLLRNNILFGCMFNFIESWLKAIVFESEAIEATVKNKYLEMNLSTLLFVEDVVLVKNKTLDDINGLVEHYVDLVEKNSPQSSFNQITLLGWLVLALIKTKFIVPNNRTVEKGEIFDDLKNSLLLKIISNSIKATEDQSVWPTEFRPLDTIKNENEACNNFEEIINSLKSIDTLFESETNTINQLVNITTEYFEYSNIKNKFRDRWEIKKWQINIAGENQAYTENIDGELLSNWSETRTSKDKPLYVSIYGRRYGAILNALVENNKPIGIILDTAAIENNEAIGITLDTAAIENNEAIGITLDTAAIENNEAIGITLDTAAIESNEAIGITLDTAAIESNEAIGITLDTATTESNEQVKNTTVFNDESTDNPTLKDNCKTKTKVSPPLINHNFFNSAFYKLQLGTWESRKSTKAPSHIRAAFIQLNLNDECCGDSYDCVSENEEIEKYKKQEYNRQLILEKSLEACHKLGVEYLVLPEYSVQPTTITWLQKELKSKEYDISILAGTYRLIPEKIKEQRHHFEKNNISASYKKKLKDYQAILTLLVPFKGKIFTLNRAKKYASPAANELICPSNETIKPLFTLADFESEVFESVNDISTVNSAMTTISNYLNGREHPDFLDEIGKINAELAKNRLPLSEYKKMWTDKHIRPLNFILELVCAELFLLTNPTNYNNLSTEFVKLSKHFGSTSKQDLEVVIKDLIDVSKYLSYENIDKDPYRRSIISIPAMTTRNEDYWLFGQSAMLANGFSTIFCNGVSKGYAKGGSCFIGLDSWHVDNKENEFITPYNNWSKGIYYGEPKSALGEESALVVADIDPLMMSQGKPRPQATPVPMRLVGYLPIIEITSQCGKQGLSNIMSSFDELSETIGMPKLTTSNLSPSTLDTLTKNIKELLSLDSEVKKASDDRIKHWEKYYKKNPMAGMPGALTDWIAIELAEESQASGSL